MKRTLSLIAGVVFIVAAGLAWTASRSVRTAEVARLEIAKKRLHTEAELQYAVAQLAEAKQTEADLRSALAEPQRANASNVVKAPDASPKPMADDLARFLKYREALHARRIEDNKATATQLRKKAWSRVMCAMVDATFFKTQGLSPTQIEKFLELKTNHAAELRDVEALIDEGTVAQDDPVIAQFKRHKQAEHDAAMRDLLGGDEAMKALSEYERTFTPRYILGGIAGTAAVAGVPFTNTQLEQLVTIVANASPSYQRGKWAGNDIDWTAVDAQARAILTDRQFTVFTKYNGPEFMGSRFHSIRSGAEAKAEAEDKAAQAAAKPSSK